MSSVTEGCLWVGLFFFLVFYGVRGVGGPVGGLPEWAVVH